MDVKNVVLVIKTWYAHYVNVHNSGDVSLTDKHSEWSFVECSAIFSTMPFQVLVDSRAGGCAHVHVYLAHPTNV